jgi:hypothetical protein
MSPGTGACIGSVEYGTWAMTITPYHALDHRGTGDPEYRVQGGSLRGWPPCSRCIKYEYFIFGV